MFLLRKFLSGNKNLKSLATTSLNYWKGGSGQNKMKSIITIKFIKLLKLFSINIWGMGQLPNFKNWCC